MQTSERYELSGVGRERESLISYLAYIWFTIKVFRQHCRLLYERRTLKLKEAIFSNELNWDCNFSVFRFSARHLEPTCLHPDTCEIQMKRVKSRSLFVRLKIRSGFIFSCKVDIFFRRIQNQSHEFDIRNAFDARTCRYNVSKISEM